VAASQVNAFARSAHHLSVQQHKASRMQPRDFHSGRPSHRARAHRSVPARGMPRRGTPAGQASIMAESIVRLGNTNTRPLSMAANSSRKRYPMNNAFGAARSRQPGQDHSDNHLYRARPAAGTLRCSSRPATRHVGIDGPRQPASRRGSAPHRPEQFRFTPAATGAGAGSAWMRVSPQTVPADEGPCGSTVEAS